MRTFSMLALVSAGAGCAFSSPEVSSRGQARPRPLGRAGAGGKAGCLARTKKVTLTMMMMVMTQLM